jgi:putative acetyltransferase
MNKESPDRYLLRAAQSTDAEAIIQVHFAAVRSISSKFYAPEVLDAWSPHPHEARYEWMRQIIATEVVVVARTESDIVGFALLLPSTGELRALYVHPTAARQGVGQKLLQRVEAEAEGCGLSRLWLNASLNAEAFYKRQGYKNLSQDALILSGGHQLACVRMEKPVVSRNR